MTTTTTNYTINTLPKTKKEIVEHLFKEGHINLDEVLELMKEQAITVTPITPQQPWPTTVPYNPTDWPYPWTVTYTGGLGNGNSEIKTTY